MRRVSSPGCAVAVPAVVPFEEALSVVVTLLLVPVECPGADAVTVVASVPDVCPAFALTVRVMAALVAPGARATELEPSVEALKFVVLPSDGASVNVVEEHAAVSLFLTVTV
jgi:hypothetical protein